MEDSSNTVWLEIFIVDELLLLESMETHIATTNTTRRPASCACLFIHFYYSAHAARHKQSRPFYQFLLTTSKTGDLSDVLAALTSKSGRSALAAVIVTTSSSTHLLQILHWSAAHELLMRQTEIFNLIYFNGLNAAPDHLYDLHILWQ